MDSSFSMKSLDSIIENSQAGWIVADGSNNLMYMNKTAKRLLQFDMHLHEENVNIQQIVPGLINSNESKSLIMDQNITLGGQNRFLYTIRLPDGMNIFLLLTKKIAVRIREFIAMEKELDDILKYSFDGIGVVGADFKITRMNPAYEKLAGIRNGEYLGHVASDLLTDGYVDKLAAYDAAKLKQSVFVIQRYLKTNKVALVTCNPVISPESGETIRVITNVRELTAFFKMHDELTKSASGISAANKGNLLSMGSAVPKVVYQSGVMEKLMQLIYQIAKVDSNVLITGESGVGKGLFSKVLHKLSDRNTGPFITINCGAIPEYLIESELFGYAPGAFTGAKKEGKIGIIETAENGVLFLDEIGELPISLQPKFLQFLQDGVFTKVGGTKPVAVNVRVIAATNQSLLTMVNEGKFRRDLYYRLNVVPLVIPPLREHKQDLPILIEYYAAKTNEKFQLAKKISEEAIKILENYDWPGNVRELEHLIEAAFIAGVKDEIGVDEILPLLDMEHMRRPLVKDAGWIDYTEQDLPYREIMQAFEKRLFQTAIERHGSLKNAAIVLQVDPSTIWRRLRKQ